jgi:hypothetical protein
MPLDEESFKRKIEEFKEVGHDYRYRDQLMVQEFSLSMVATGVLLNVVVKNANVIESLIFQLFGVIFLALLTVHLRHINQDRIAALRRKETLRSELEFQVVHLNVHGHRRMSAPGAMVWFTGSAAVVWGAWSVGWILKALCMP